MSTEGATPGVYRVSDESAVALSDARTEWGAAAYTILVDTARAYHAVITYKEMADEVQERTGIRTRMLLTNWIGGVLEVAAHTAAGKGEPPLTSLCVKQDGTVGPGYAKAPKAIDDVPGEDIQTYAAAHRHLCYQKYARDLPADGGRPALTVQEQARRDQSKRAESVSAPVCPTCFTRLPATGVCDYCAE